VIPPASLDLVSEYWSGKRAWNEADWVTLGNADRTLDLVLRRGDRVSGIVRDTRGIPIEGATININDDRGPLVGSDTDISGTYSVVVPRGHYQIEVFAPRVSELLSQTPRDLDTNGFTRMDFVLEDARP
jgi:hypothetical protein